MWANGGVSLKTHTDFLVCFMYFIKSQMFMKLSLFLGPGPSGSVRGEMGTGSAPRGLTDSQEGQTDRQSMRREVPGQAYIEAYIDLLKRDDPPTLEEETGYPEQVPADLRNGGRASAERRARVEAHRAWWVGKHRGPKAEIDAGRHGVSGGQADSALGNGC